jgi:hypothetical protein
MARPAKYLPWHEKQALLDEVRLAVGEANYQKLLAQGGGEDSLATAWQAAKSAPPAPPPAPKGAPASGPLYWLAYLGMLLAWPPLLPAMLQALFSKTDGLPPNGRACLGLILLLSEGWLLCWIGLEARTGQGEPKGCWEALVLLYSILAAVVLALSGLVALLAVAFRPA